MKDGKLNRTIDWAISIGFWLVMSHSCYDVYLWDSKLVQRVKDGGNGSRQVTAEQGKGGPAGEEQKGFVAMETLALRLLWGVSSFLWSERSQGRDSKNRYTDLDTRHLIPPSSRDSRLVTLTILSRPSGHKCFCTALFC